MPVPLPHVVAVHLSRSARFNPTQRDRALSLQALASRAGLSLTWTETPARRIPKAFTLKDSTGAVVVASGEFSDVAGIVHAAAKATA